MHTKYLEIIKAPIITEKSSNDQSNYNKYTFKVDTKSNKTEIKEAVQKIFGVKVLEVQTINVKPKKKRVGRYSGFTKKYKKAIITLEPGQTLETK
jgi:ribosomal protein L23